MLKRRAVRFLRWLGLGADPTVGISYDDRFVVVAVVDPEDRRIRGVSIVELDPRTVVSGTVERPAELTAALRSALAALRLPSGTVAGACLPIGLDHRGSEWPSTGPTAATGDPGEAVIDAARSAGVTIRSAVPLAVVGARLGALATGGGGRADAGAAEPVSVVVRSGWLCSIVNTADRFVESRTERSDEFRTPPDVRWGLSAERAGAEIDPFSWPREIRDRRRIALLAAGAAMVP